MQYEQSRRFYVVLAFAISATAYLGFYFTYFSLVATGKYPSVSPAIHIHGWSFFLWYLLVPVQAVLIAARRRRLHVALGYASLALAAVMTLTGLLVASVRLRTSLDNGGAGVLDAFWAEFGLVISFSLVLFVGFYVAAIAYRGQPQLHKRLMIMASVSALPAAVFRIIVAFGGYHWLETPNWVLPAAIFLPNVIIVLGMVRDFVTLRSVNRVYILGLTIAVVIQGLGFGLATNPAGDSLRQFLAMFSRLFGLTY